MDNLLFVGSIAGILFLLFAYAAYKSGEGWRYIKTEKGAGALKSALLFGCANQDKGEWFDYGRIYMGVDQTRGQSPQCEDGGPSDKLTSNGGFEAGIYTLGRFGSYLKYTHHSCAISPDNKSYDAAGFGIEYRLW